MYYFITLPADIDQLDIYEVRTNNNPPREIYNMIQLRRLYTGNYSIHFNFKNLKNLKYYSNTLFSSVTVNDNYSELKILISYKKLSFEYGYFSRIENIKNIKYIHSIHHDSIYYAVRNLM